jgi:hypothetical protein
VVSSSASAEEWPRNFSSSAKACCSWRTTAVSTAALAEAGELGEGLWRDWVRFPDFDCPEPDGEEAFGRITLRALIIFTGLVPPELILPPLLLNPLLSVGRSMRL